METTYEYDQPFSSVTLLPIPNPSPEQLKLVRALGKITDQNLLELRAVLQAGGFQAFGLLLSEQAEDIGRRLGGLCIPYRVDHLPDRRHIRGKTIS